MTKRLLIASNAFVLFACSLSNIFCHSDAFFVSETPSACSLVPDKRTRCPPATWTTHTHTRTCTVAVAYTTLDANDAHGDAEKRSNQPTEVAAKARPPCDSDVIVICGGLVGAATGVPLSRRAADTSCTIYEQAGALKTVGAAIGLYPNGLSALEYISPSVLEAVRTNASPCLVFERRDASTDEVVKTTSVPGLNETAPVMYAWFLLQKHLSEALPEGCLQLGHAFRSYEVLDDERVSVCLVDRSNRQLVTKTCRLLIGADGIHSRVRGQLLGKAPTVRYYGKVMYRAVLDRNRTEGVPEIPVGSQISWQGTEIGKSFSIRETTTDGILTVTAAALTADPEPQQDSAGEDTTNTNTTPTRKQRLAELFSTFPPSVRTIIDRLPEDLVHEDFLRDVDVPSETDWFDGPVVLVGDAVHAMTPGMGQGANQGLEDVCELVEAIARGFPLSDYVRARIDRVTGIRERSAENTRQSNAYTGETASTPFRRRKYSADFKRELYEWKPVLETMP